MARNVFKKLAALLFICAVILLVIKQMTFAEKKPEKKPQPKAGYVEIKQEDYDKLIKESEDWKKKYEGQLEKASTNKEESVKVLYLNIGDGMTSKDVSEQLAKAGLIKTADDMNTYLSKNNMQRLLQIGEYELNSQMDIETMAKIITGQKEE
ncbi:hypothetical protein [Siminovitchia sp. FSL W7-1587]|uniref:hypothetical protein n=1 Tax=Siminovitchia sp. FSL W7-1587 TaxID=2954699 RepID=UPI0030D41199